MHRRLIAAATLIAVLALAGTASASSWLSTTLHARFREPSRVTVTVTASPARTVYARWALACGSERSSGRYSAPSGAPRRLTLPSGTLGACTLTLRAGVSGYGRISVRSFESGR